MFTWKFQPKATQNATTTAYYEKTQNLLPVLGRKYHKKFKEKFSIVAKNSSLRKNLMKKCGKFHHLKQILTKFIKALILQISWLLSISADYYLSNDEKI